MSKVENGSGKSESQNPNDTDELGRPIIRGIIDRTVFVGRRSIKETAAEVVDRLVSSRARRI